MRQYRETDYWIGRGGEVSRYYPDRLVKSSSYKGKQYYRRLPEKWKLVKPFTQNKHGYYTISSTGLSSSSLTKTRYLHRLVAEIYVPGYFEGAHVDHIDCNKFNNHYTNLQWCTSEYNSTKGDNTTFPLYIEWNK